MPLDIGSETWQALIMIFMSLYLFLSPLPSTVPLAQWAEGEHILETWKIWASTFTSLNVHDYCIVFVNFLNSSFWSYSPGIGAASKLANLPLTISNGSLLVIRLTTYQVQYTSQKDKAALTNRGRLYQNAFPEQPGPSYRHVDSGISTPMQPQNAAIYANYCTNFTNPSSRSLRSKSHSEILPTEKSW